MKKRDMFLVGAATGMVVGGLTWFITRQLTEPAEVVPLSDGEPFPSVSGTSLSGEPMTVPDDLAGSVGVLLLGWEYSARFEIDAWMQILKEQYTAFPDLRIMILPMISGVGRLMRTVIDSAMVRGIPEEDLGHVLTIYGDLRALRSRLNVSHPRYAQLFLLGRTGRVAWRSEGPPSEERLFALQEALAAQGMEKKVKGEDGGFD